MPKFIKSHSNYRLSTLHQTTGEGKILERDISTVGGVPSFTAGQSTVYSSGNLIISINNTKEPARHVILGGWISNGTTGDVWDAEAVENHGSDVEGSVESEFYPNNDYSDFRSYACFGSLYDLVRNSISSILAKYPYEAYTGSIGGGNAAEYVQGDSEYEVYNPGFIDMHTNYVTGGELTDYFKNGGYLSYRMFNDDDKLPEEGVQFYWESTVYPQQEQCPVAGHKVADIKMTPYTATKKYADVIMHAYWNDSLELRYTVSEEYLGYHIRPVEERMVEFNDSIDLFQKCLMGKFSGVDGRSMFEVMQEENGVVVRRLETFDIPKGAGGYNIDTDGRSMSEYVSRMSSIALKYDDEYTDGTYRMYVYQSLKNLDWTGSYDGGDNGEVNEYTETGEKFKSVIRIIGYFLDLEKMKIDSIANSNSVTYNKKNSTEDYYLTDFLSERGWDVSTVYPVNLQEFSYKDGSDVTDKVYWDELEQSFNTNQRRFGDITYETFVPYGLNEFRHYTTCIDGHAVDIDTDEEGSYINDNGVTRNIISDFHSDREYTMSDANNQFMRRLLMNSSRIFSKKGTVEGIESLLSIFGMRSRRWYESVSGTTDGSIGDNVGDKRYDFDIKEYTAFAAPITDTYDERYSMHLIDYINSCKTIAYDTQSFLDGIYIPYQGLPVAYREMEDGSRRLYPYFQQGGIYDGGMYYQMYGGWLRYYPYKFDKDDNILKSSKYALIDNEIFDIYCTSGTENVKYLFFVQVTNGMASIGNNIYSGSFTYSSETGTTTVDLSTVGFLDIYYTGNEEAPFIIRDESKSPSRMDMREYDIYTETLRNIYVTDNLETLVSQPVNILKDGNIFYVKDIDGEYAIIDGFLYEMKPYEENGVTYKYFSAYVKSGTVTVGDITYVSNITVSTEGTGGNTRTYSLDTLADGYEIRIFYLEGQDEPFIITDGLYTPESMLVFKDRSYEGVDIDVSTNYFILRNRSMSDKIGPNTEYGTGWEQLFTDSSEYNTTCKVVDNFLGNNPHFGGEGYDGGYEYMSRMNKLFKYAYANSLFDMSCIADESEAEEIMTSAGFSGITDTEFVTKQGSVIDYKDYSRFLHEDKKSHSFVTRRDELGFSEMYDIEDKESIAKKEGYGFVRDIENADGVTSQIINTKVTTLTFYLKSGNPYTKEGQEEVYYIQKKIMPYVEQMIPSNSIMKVKFA